MSRGHYNSLGCFTKLPLATATTFQHALTFIIILECNVAFVYPWQNHICLFLRPFLMLKMLVFSNVENNLEKGRAAETNRPKQCFLIITFVMAPVYCFLATSHPQLLTFIIVPFCSLLNKQFFLQKTAAKEC